MSYQESSNILHSMPATTGNKDSRSTEVLQGGRVFNIQKFSLHDGPGIRDLIFLKGCPLHCRWCSNPESQKFHPELTFNQKECLGSDVCGLCKTSCPTGAIAEAKDGSIAVDWPTCTSCGDCSEICPTGALDLAGKEMSVDEILGVVEKDGGFHRRSGGGITVSGGEPIVQAEFVNRLLLECRRRLIHTAVETTGYGSWEKLYTTVEHADVVLYDIKSMDDSKHQKFTGVSNKVILENLKRLTDSCPNLSVTVRTPVIPGFNDSEKDIGEIVHFLSSSATPANFQLLPFHRLGIAKYGYLGKSCDYADTPNVDASLMKQLNAIAATFRGAAKQKSLTE